MEHKIVAMKFLFTEEEFEAADVPKLSGKMSYDNIDPWKSQGWCRGMSFDFPILVDLIRDEADNHKSNKC